MNVNASDGKCPGKKGADENQSCGSTRLNPSLVESKGMLKNRKKKNNKKSLFQQKMLVLKSRYNKPTLLQRVRLFFLFIIKSNQLIQKLTNLCY